VTRQTALLGLLAAALSWGCSHVATDTASPLRTVASVDLDRYLGTWYEIARYPHRFQEGCVASMATYTKRDDGRIRVVNTCREGTPDGKLRRAEGVAWVAKRAPSSARLLVQFFWPFRGDYWIIELDPDYRHVVVGHPSRTYLWILARSPHMDEPTYQELRRRIAAHGYDLTPLQRTPQPTP
jgi:apolipoprotein D and lipocalin family protein